MTVATAMSTAWKALPQGKALSEETWRQRHRAILILLALHLPGIILFAVLAGYGWRHGLVECVPVAGALILACLPTLHRQARSVIASTGLLICSAVLVHLSNGHIELHFHYFVAVMVIALYEDWVPFLAALAFVVGEHGFLGVVAPHSVYNHQSGVEHPWLWAGVHGGFILAASAACVVNWRLNENERSRVELLLDSAAEGIYGVDPAGRLTFINESAARMLGRDPHAIVRHPIHEIVHGSRQDGAAHAAEDCWIQAAVASDRPSPAGEDVFWTESGLSLPIEYTTMPIHDRGRLMGAVVTFRDVSVRKQQEAQLAHQANYDELTGLANRRLLAEQLTHALTRASARHITAGVLFIDLDRFKIVNDSLGHAAGDALLVEIAGRIDATVRSEDTVARLGGDEFAVLMQSIAGPEEACALAERLIEAIQQPLKLFGREIVTTASVGIALSLPAKPYLRPGDLLRDGDIAMYRAKALGGSRAAIFEASMSILAAERLELENDLRRAVEQGELRVQYQPEVNLRSGVIVGMEALVRWDHPRLGMLQPARFITIAEETNIILELGHWVMDEACRQLREWQLAWPDAQDLIMAVNLSVRQLRKADIVDEVAAILRKHQLAAGSLRLEITESVMMQDPPATIGVLHALKALGVKLAIDDFGTGYSSLSHLQRFPVETLKIDRSFVIAMDHDEATRSIVTAVMALSQALGLEVTAEGIETEGHLANMEAVACDRGQGFYFSEPVSPGEITAAYLASRTGEPWAALRDSPAAKRAAA